MYKLRVSPDVCCGLWVTVMCLEQATNCSKCTTVVKIVDEKKACVCMAEEGTWELPVLPFHSKTTVEIMYYLQFSCKSKTSEKCYIHRVCIHLSMLL